MERLLHDFDTSSKCSRCGDAPWTRLNKGGDGIVHGHRLPEYWFSHSPFESSVAEQVVLLFAWVSEHLRPGDAKTLCQVLQLVTDAAVEFEENQHIRKPAECDRAQKDKDVCERDGV